tara:strand:- start:382 stop:588 length:207 start_codon:yes stop_codon:yes gene_type:complete
MKVKLLDCVVLVRNIVVLIRRIMMSKMKEVWAQINGVYERPGIIEFHCHKNIKDKERTSGNKRLNKKI